MAPISTEAVNQLGHTSELRSGAGAGPRTQAVSIEIPVLVRGSRRVASVPGQPGKLEHFSEETTTVVVFAQGAVVRLVGSAKAGQLVGLTNRQTGKEALCRIVNIKHFPDTRGYVEIEFNHAMNGFWQTALSQEAAGVPANPKKNGSSPLDTLVEMSAEQLLRANPKELKAQLLEMAALLKAPAEEVPAEPSVAPATAQGFWKRSAAPEPRQPAASPEPPAPAIESAPVDPAEESREFAVENSQGAAPLAGIAQVTGGAEEQPGASSSEADLEVSEIGVSEFDLAADANHAAVTSGAGSLEAAIAEDASVAETEQESAAVSLPAGEWPLASSSDTVVTEPEISSHSSHGVASLAVDPPSAGAEDLDAELESLLQPLHGLSESNEEISSTEARAPEAWSAGEAETDPQLAAALARHEQASEEPEQAAGPVENLDRDDLSPEDMWNAGSIVHSNLDRPSAGSSDADMRASEEKTLENTRLAELKAALVTPSAEAAMREDGFRPRTPETEPSAQALSLESVWSLFRSLNKSVPATANESEHDAASLKLFASGAIADVRQVDSESAHAAELGADDTDGATNKHPRQETQARAKASGVDESTDRGESDEESETRQESAANHHPHAANSGHDEQDETDEAEAQDSEADADEDDEDSSPRAAEPNPRKPDIVPQWYSTNPAAAASKPWSTPGSTAVQGTMAPTLAKRESGGKSVLAHAAATLVLLAAGAAAFHTLRPSVSYLMKAPSAPPAVDPDENAAARDAAVASLSVPPLPADIQARVAKSVPTGTAKPAEGASGSSGVTQVPVPGGASAPLRVGEGVRAPRVRSKIQPVVPYAASASGIGGDVILSVVVDNSGRVATARVVSGPGVLRNAALEAVRQWEYEPALQNGRPVAVQIYVTVNFPRH
jgi:protein TonB